MKKLFIALVAFSLIACGVQKPGRNPCLPKKHSRDFATVIEQGPRQISNKMFWTKFVDINGDTSASWSRYKFSAGDCALILSK